MSSKFYTRFFIIGLLIFTHSFAIGQTNEDSLLKIMGSTKEDSTKLKLLIKLSVLNQLSDLKQSFAYANQAVDLAKKRNFQDELLETYKVFGKICFEKGLMIEAGKYFSLCLDLITKKGNKLQMAMANNNIAATFQSVKNFKVAESYYLKSLQLLKEYALDNGDTTISAYVINIYNNLGTLSKDVGNIPKALTNFELGIKRATNLTEYPNTRIALLQNKGLLLIETAKYDEANLKIQKSIEIGENLQFGFGLATSYMLKGDLLSRQGKTRDALYNLQKGYAYAKSTESLTLIQKLSHELHQIYKDLGKADSALKYLNISIESENAMKIQEARELLEINENKKLFAAWQLEESNKYQKNVVKNLIITFLGILATVILFVFYIIKQKQYKRVLLEKIEKDIAIQNLELERKLLLISLEDKEKQLANDILYQIQKNEIIEAVVDKLLHQTKQATGINVEAIKDAIKTLSKTTENNVWSEFEIRFKQVHANFYENLQQKFPDLTRNERRLCAFLRLNMSSKEISAISGQSPKTIDVARSRLRKKLGISNDDMGLISFLNGI